MMLRYMIPAINHTERIELFSGLKQNAPQPAFNAVIVLAHSVLPADEWENLKLSLFSEKNELKVWEAVA